MKKIKAVLKLFFLFFKIGLFTFGGGYAMISIIEKEVVEKNKWLTKEEMMDIVAIGESTPGPISLNISTFVGYRAGGFAGSLMSTVGLIMPPFIIISILSMFIMQWKEIAIIGYAMRGIRACVVVLVFSAFLKFLKRMRKAWYAYALLGVAFLVALLTEIDVVWIILFAGLLGVLGTVIIDLVINKRPKKSKK